MYEYEIATRPPAERIGGFGGVADARRYLLETYSNSGPNGTRVLTVAGKRREERLLARLGIDPSEAPDPSVRS